MSAPDLTRWNRAGLTRFRYVDGNAVAFLETLRSELAVQFPGWTPIQTPAGETAAQREARIARQYEEPRNDWAWDIIRAFARSCHVLGEYIDAYANEGYLRTATQWDSVRKIVAMLDVHPAPPASAAALLVIEAKSEPGTLSPGFAVKHTPKSGSPVVFETLEELALDPELNALRLAEWNLSPAPLIDLPPEIPRAPIAKLSARAIQGVGARYQAMLDARAPLSSGIFTVADFHTFDPAQLGARHALRIWEAKSKAEVLLDFPWTATELDALSKRHLPELRAMTPAALALATGRTASDMTQFLEELRTAEAMLDEDVFATSRLEELLSPGAPAADPPPLWEAPEDSGISAGQMALVVRAAEGTEQAAVARIAYVEAATREITLESVPNQPLWQSWTRGVSSLLAKPKVIAVAHLAGSPAALTFAAPHALAAGDPVAWQTGGTWTFASVAKADDVGVLLSGTVQPPAGTEVFRGVDVDALSIPAGYRAAATLVNGKLEVLADTERTERLAPDNTVAFFTVTRPGATSVVFVPGGARAAGRVAAVASSSGDGKFRFGGKPGDLQSGEWVVGEDRGRLLALCIARIEPLEDHFAVTFESVVDPSPAVASLPASILMGVGRVTTGLLRPIPIETVGQLAKLQPALDVAGLSSTERLALRAKARIATGFAFSERDLERILDTKLPQLLAMTKQTLGDALGKPSAWAADLLEELRLLQAVIDEPTVAVLRVRDLLPIGAARPVMDYELTRLDRLYGVFEHTVRPSNWNVNDTAVSGGRLLLELVPPTRLARGRRLVLQRDGVAREATVASIDSASRTLDLTPTLTEDEGFTLGNLVIHANVARAGHGETKPAKVLGSGDASRRSQSFILKEDDVAFVADATMSTGVAAAVTVSVAGQVWQQVATLRDSEPTDAHYEVRLTEDRYLEFTFGDGLRGRRLPTGTNNVRVAFRVGSGLSGNVAAGGLNKPARPNALVDAVSQPLDASGGNDREDVASLKSQAPKSVLTLERAVSLSDFSALAARQSSVWQARAFALPTGGGRHASVDVVVVPAGGGQLGSLAADLKAFLTTNGLPGIDVRVTAYEPKPFSLQVELEVKSAEFDRDEVRKNVESALLDTFSLRRRALGASLFVSEVYALVENVTGVEISKVNVGFGTLGNARVLSAAPRQVVFLDEASSRISVTVKEFVL